MPATTEKAKGSNIVTVNIRIPHGSVKIFDPTVGTSPIQVMGANDAVSLTLTDHPLILSL